jgi:hypothetical protein
MATQALSHNIGSHFRTDSTTHPRGSLPVATPITIASVMIPAFLVTKQVQGAVRPPFIGRGSEMAELRRAFGLVQKGHAAIVYVHGGSGSLSSGWPV